MALELTVHADADYCLQQARIHDRDRYLATLFAPENVRRDLLALLAFNSEIAKIPGLVSEPLLGQIRLQWWREAIDGIYRDTPRDHPVVRALFKLIERRQLPRSDFDRLIDARVVDLDDTAPDSLAALVKYAADTSSTLCALTLGAVDIGDDGDDGSATHKAGHEVGVAWGLICILRSHIGRTSSDRNFLPTDLVDTLGEMQTLERIAERARAHLTAARTVQAQVPKAALPAFLPAVLAQRYLGRRTLFKKQLNGATPLDQLALYRAARRGRY